jgi:adenylate kinase
MNPNRHASIRVLFTGISGTGVHASLEKLGKFIRDKGRIVHIFRLEPVMLRMARERRLIKKTDGIVGMLGLSRSVLRTLWTDAFRSVMKEIDRCNKHEDIFLSLHACYYHVRAREFFTVVDEKELSRFGPDLVVNLIDDLYYVLRRLSEKRGLFEPVVSSGKTATDFLIHFVHLFQILNWRSTETLLTDHLIEASFRGKVPVKVLAVKHPLTTIHKLIYSINPICFYLSHPISEPRRMRASRSR